MGRFAVEEALVRLRNQLEAQRWPADVAKERGVHYLGPADFVIREGKMYRPAPGIVPRGAPKACFGNAIALGAIYGLRYVEGYAVDPGLLRVAVHHAWNLTPEGLVYDTTWQNRGMVYLGVEFSLGRADDCTWNGDASVLDDFNRGWPLLREPWRGEDFERKWEPSEILEPILARDIDRARRVFEAARAGEI